MDLLNHQLLEFWSSLNNNGVEYIMVGGFAVRFNGLNRSTDDLDLWLHDTLENRKRFRKAYAEAGYGDYPSLETIQFVPGWVQFYIGNGVVLDIMTSMKGLEEKTFSDCLSNAKVAEIKGIKVPFLHINDLISNKLAVGRPRDLSDAAELEKIRKITGS